LYEHLSIDEDGNTEVDVGQVSTQLDLPTVRVQQATFTINLDVPAQVEYEL
jgi:hypothetical protein